MRDYEPGLKRSVTCLMALCYKLSSLSPLKAQTPSAAVAKIESDYQQLMHGCFLAGCTAVVDMRRLLAGN